MAPVKRKNEVTQTDIRPEKKQKSTPAPKSWASKEEAAFPRGGASVLTPLEHKQIQIQAKQDVLFEQSTGKKATRKDFEDEENEEELPQDNASGLSKPKAQSRSKGQKGTKNGLVKDKTVRIEGLSYKRLVPGSMVLGQVSAINKHDIALSLPNNLTGYVPLTSISDTITERLEVLAKSEHLDEEQEEANDDQIDPTALFSIGQYLRAYVVSTESETGAAGGKGKRHIELSLNPRVSNFGLKTTEFVVNSMVQASVHSVEDHGLIMDLGLEDTSMRGFMSSKELGQFRSASTIVEGTVILCLVMSKSSNGKTVTLSADQQRISNIKKNAFLSDAPTVDAFLPGSAVDILVSEVTPAGVTGKIMGLLDVTADLIHSGAASSGKDLEKKYPSGSKVKGRIICTFPNADEKKLGISLQDHILYWREKSASTNGTDEALLPTHSLPISTVVDMARVLKVETGCGLLVDVGVKGVRGFVHISKISDSKIETLFDTTGPYKVGSIHKARIIGYNAMDGLFIVSLEPKVISQAFLRMEDVRVGEVVKGTVGKLLVNEHGVNGLIVSISEGVSGLVPESHFADVHLQHPEKRFKEGGLVTARVLSTNPEKKQIRLTLKKTLINSDTEPWTKYEGLKPGMQSPGTLVNVLPKGAVVQFYGSVRGFLPASEMTESYIEDPRQHFREGQVVNVHIVSVDPDAKRMMVSCKDPSTFGSAQLEAFNALKVGESVSGTVTEKTTNEIVLQLDESGLNAMLSNEHLVDGTAAKAISAAKRIRVGQTMRDLMVLSKKEHKHFIRLTSKASLIKAANDEKLLKRLDDVVEGTEVVGFVNNITPTTVFVQFAGDLVGLILKSQISNEALVLPNFGLRRNQSISTRVLSVDHAKQRFLLTMKPSVMEKPKAVAEATGPETLALSNPVDDLSTSIEDFSLGKITKAKVVSIKDTQLNVQLADGVQGRIDVSEISDKWEEIKDRKHPLKKFRAKEVLPVRILGMHDTRNHRFLPITHRGKAPVFELTAKPSNQTSSELDVLTIDKVELGTDWLVYVNNIGESCLWVNLSPNVRGRIQVMDISDDVTLLKDLPKNFPVGSVLRVKVLGVNVENNRLDLTARKGGLAEQVTLRDLAQGMVLPGRVTKATERQAMVQLSDKISGPIHLIDMADDYSKVDPSAYRKNQILRVCVKDVDARNQRVSLSTRPSKVLSSSLPVKDPELSSIEQLKVNDVVRGFINNVADNGIFVSLASNITAFVRVTDLSDSFIKDWKAGFEIDQLVKGKIIAVDPMLSHVQMSLKKSNLESEYRAPLAFTDMHLGQIVAGKVRKVEDYGVFIVVDDSLNVSGLCHRTKMSDRSGANPKRLYEEGDAVQAKVLNINNEKRQISFGLKASYFQDQVGYGEPKTILDDRDNDAEDDVNSANPMGEVENGAQIGLPSDAGKDGGMDDHVDLVHVKDLGPDVDTDGGDARRVDIELNREADPIPSSTHTGLITGGFDWAGGPTSQINQDAQSETDGEATQPNKKKRRKAEIKIDKTGELDAKGPQSTADFERLLLGRPNESELWVGYMAFQLQLGEVTKARQVAERALKTINIRDEGEKLNVWSALLSLENTFGREESLDDVFRRACQHNDSQKIHEHLISLYIKCGAHQKADALYQATLKKHSQSPALYLNYADFLLTTLADPDRAHAILPRALQALPTYTHLDLSSKFAQLEFNSPHGEPERGRTIFETLLAQWPKRLDLWNVLLDLETKKGNVEVVRRLYERITGPSMSLKPKKARPFFKRWLDYEEKVGDVRTQERVKALAAEYVSRQGAKGGAE